MLDNTSEREITSFNMLGEAAASNSVSSTEPISAALSQYKRELKYSCHSELLILEVSADWLVPLTIRQNLRGCFQAWRSSCLRQFSYNCLFCLNFCLNSIRACLYNKKSAHQKAHACISILLTSKIYLVGKKSHLESGP